MSAVIDPVDLLCGPQNAPFVPPHAMASPLMHDASHMTSPATYSNQFPPWLQSPTAPLTGDALAFAFGMAGIASPSNASLSLPPGLDVPRPAVPGGEPAQTNAGPIHVWALEAKIKAEQAQARQREWAEKMQLQYLRGQEVLKALHENTEDHKPESSNSQDANNSEGAFDRLVKQIGLASETPPRGSGAGTGQNPPVECEQTPPKQLFWDVATPTKNRRSPRKTGEKENEPSSSGWPAKSENTHSTPGRRSRGGRRARALNYR